MNILFKTDELLGQLAHGPQTAEYPLILTKILYKKFVIIFCKLSQYWSYLIFIGNEQISLCKEPEGIFRSILGF